MAHTVQLSSSWWPLLLGLAAGALLVSGVDDLVPLLICVSQWIRPRKSRSPGTAAPLAAGATEIERRIAIFVPCWKEAGVIANMVRHNLAAIRYSNYDFFLGAYPNDEATVAVVEELSATYRNVHVAVCPNPGPTSKADCLNSIYARMCQWEEECGLHFSTVVLHDAEDLIHPDALSIVNRERCRYAMVQIPVLPLPTPSSEFTHAVYCDEFAEFQTIDMPARFISGSFIPSNGVGTGFARHILQRLAHERPTVFDPQSLTEDYEIGVYIHRIGHHQLFVPLTRGERGIIATREYFPRRVKSAIRQRTRWITGIALQGWERDGWRGSWITRYWFWRDRKGLLANPLSLLTNVFTLVGLADWIEAMALHRPWAFAVSNPFVWKLCFATAALQGLRMSLRMTCVGRLYGPVFAATLPLRAIFSNFINCSASFAALLHFLRAKAFRKPLVWLKTDHAYPDHQALPAHQRDLRHVLITSGLITEEQLSSIQTIDGDELLDQLYERGLMTDEERCQMLSLQSGLPSVQVDVDAVPQRVVRSLPAHVERRFGVVPFSVRNGRLLLASTRVPRDKAFEELRAYTRLPVEFRLVTRTNYDELRQLL